MHGRSESLVDLEHQLGERMVTFAILDAARANGLAAIERSRIDQECEKILREVGVLHERIAVARASRRRRPDRADGR